MVDCRSDVLYCGGECLSIRRMWIMTPRNETGSDRRLELELCAPWGTWGKAEIGKAES
jgi:hypothetical protein